jgi:predicted O-methyltransferase YrrM
MTPSDAPTRATRMRTLIRMALPIADLMLAPLVWLAAWLLKLVRRIGIRRLPTCRGTLMHVGIYPVRDHYYEPQFDHRHPRQPYSADRSLPGIDWNVEGQLNWLKQFTRADELTDLPIRSTGELEFYLDNGAFLSGDAEVWYQLVRATKPRRIFEIGSGHSTRMAIRALNRNRADDATYCCRHVCIEPYEMPWLEQSGVEAVRERVEDLPVTFFSELEAGDILFIDSSHIIRPQGDVLFEYLELLPTLAPGVIVHVHDIFSPKNYLEQWLVNDVMFWNEQYLLEAFLTHNPVWQIVGALNFLHHHHYDALKAVAPNLRPEREPGSMYLRKIA